MHPPPAHTHTHRHTYTLSRTCVLTELHYDKASLPVVEVHARLRISGEASGSQHPQTPYHRRIQWITASTHGSVRATDSCWIGPLSTYLSLYLPQIYIYIHKQGSNPVIFLCNWTQYVYVIEISISYCCIIIKYILQESELKS